MQYSEIKYLFLLFLLTKKGYAIIIISVTANGEVAQLARAFGSYPKGHVFESHRRYQSFRKWLKIRCFKAFETPYFFYSRLFPDSV